MKLMQSKSDTFIAHVRQADRKVQTVAEHLMSVATVVV
jgi:predicted glutamine amidotransferase